MKVSLRAERDECAKNKDLHSLAVCVFVSIDVGYLQAFDVKYSLSHIKAREDAFINSTAQSAPVFCRWYIFFCLAGKI